MKKLLVILTSLATLFACSKANKSMVKYSPKNTILIELHSGNNGDFKEEKNQVITNNTVFEKVWKQAYANFMIKDEMPEVDFEKNIVLLVAMGEKTSGGHTIKITNATETSNNTIVNVLATSPGKGCMTTESITYPFQIVQIEKPKTHVDFKVTKRVIVCESK